MLGTVEAQGTWGPGTQSLVKGRQEEEWGWTACQETGHPH